MLIPLNLDQVKKVNFAFLAEENSKCIETFPLREGQGGGDNQTEK